MLETNFHLIMVKWCRRDVMFNSVAFYFQMKIKKNCNDFLNEKNLNNFKITVPDQLIPFTMNC